MSKLALFWKHATYCLATILLTILFAGLATPARAQGGAPATIRLSPEDLERGSHGAQHNFFFLPPGKTGEDNYKSAGFFGQKLRPYLASSPTAVAELNNYRRQKTLFLVDKALTLGAVAVYATQVFAGEGDAQYFNSTQRVAAGVAVVSILGTLFINRHTNEYLKQAVDNYNSELPTGRHGALWPRLRPTGLGIGATAQGQPVLGLRWQL